MSSLLEVGYTDVILLAVLLYAIYVMFFKKAPQVERPETPEPALPAIPMQDMSVEELKKYNGEDDPRILLAVGGRVSL